MKLSRRSFLGALAQKSRPNILFMLMDDLGYSTLGCFGNTRVPTPNLDRLAREGVRFTNAYVTPQCTPTRATLLTGQYTARNKMWHVLPYYHYPYGRMTEIPFKESLNREDFTVAKGMREAGYRTGIFGKWHLTTNADGDYSHLRQSAAAHYGFDLSSKAPAIPNEQNTGDKAVLRLTNESIDFMTSSKAQPFFCYLSHHSIHGVVSAPADLTASYRAKGAPDKGLLNATYLAALDHMDRSFGVLRGALERSGQWANTAVVFLSDNGGVARNHKASPRPGADGKLRAEVNIEEFPSAPLRAWKGSAYEGGIRVPMIARFPGQRSAGRTVDTPVHAIDMMPTFFDLAGARAPGGYHQDGVSIRSLVEGRGGLAQRDLFWYQPFYDLNWLATPTAVIRSGRYKLIENFGDWIDDETREYHPEGKVELFDVVSDVGERNDLSASAPRKVKELRTKLDRWMRTCGVERPKLNSRYDPARALDTVRGKPVM